MVETKLYHLWCTIMTHCQVCSRRIQRHSKHIKCTSCASITHLKCITLSTDEQIHIMDVSPSWMCVSCIQTLFPFNYANPVYGVATSCHQVRWLRWGHPSLFHIATSLLILHKLFCVRDISYRLKWTEFINMFSVYAQSETHSRCNW